MFVFGSSAVMAQKVAKLNLTDLTVQRLKWDGKQTIYWDTKSLRGLGGSPRVIVTDRLRSRH